MALTLAALACLVVGGFGLALCRAASRADRLAEGVAGRPELELADRQDAPVAETRLSIEDFAAYAECGGPVLLEQEIRR